MPFEAHINILQTRAALSLILYIPTAYTASATRTKGKISVPLYYININIWHLSFCY